MADATQIESPRTVLLAANRSTLEGPRMAIRFAQAGCRVAAIYPSKAHPLASTQSVGSHYPYSLIDPPESLLKAIGESAAALVVPCDGLAVRHLHALFAHLPATPEGSTVAGVVERSLGDPTAYLLIDSRHEVQTAAREERLPAAESFAIGRATDPESLAQTLPFPWVLKADYSWGGRGVHIVNNIAEAREFVQQAGAPPSLAMAMKQWLVNGDRAALGEWIHAKRTGLSAQRPIEGTRASAVAACWRGELLAVISVEVVSPREPMLPPAVVRLIENPQMEATARKMSEKLGLSGFHSFEFVLESSTQAAVLTGFQSHCSGPAHVNAGPGRDLVNAFCLRWLGEPAKSSPPVHTDDRIAYFPRAWIADPNDPILNTGACDEPREDPRLVKRTMELVARDQRYLAFKAKIVKLLRR